MTTTRKKAARILVNGNPIRSRFFQQILWSVLAAAVIGFVAAGLYFGTTQVDWHVHLGSVQFQLFPYLKNDWDGLGTWLGQHTWFITPQNWPAYRHNVRDLGEPAFAGVAVMSLLAPRKYWDKRIGPLRLAVTLSAFLVVFLLLSLAGTWVELSSEARWAVLAAGAAYTLMSLALGTVMSQVLHRLFGPVGAYFQGGWVERAVDNYWRHGATRLPVYIRQPLTAPTIRERFCQKVEEDEGNGEGLQLVKEGITRRSRVQYWLAGLGVALILWLAVLGFIGHIWVGVLGHSVPYLAPGA